MKNLLLYLLSFFIVLPLVAQKASPPNDNAFNTVKYRSIAPLRINGEQGVSAPFVGTIGKSVLVAGGCNFPTTPAAQGGKKQFYADIYELTNIDDDTQQWHKIAQLPQPLAYGVSVSVPHGMVCVWVEQAMAKRVRHGFIFYIPTDNLIYWSTNCPHFPLPSTT